MFLTHAGTRERDMTEQEEDERKSQDDLSETINHECCTMHVAVFPPHPQLGMYYMCHIIVYARVVFMLYSERRVN